MTRDEMLAAWHIETVSASLRLVDRGSLLSTFVIFNGAATPRRVTADWNDNAGRDDLFRLVGLIAIAEAAVAIVWLSEAWVVLGNPNLELPPSKSERRQEVLLSAVIGRNTDTGELLHQAAVRHMDRDLAGKLVGLSDMDLPPGVEAQGRLVELLPPETPTLAERRRAREMVHRATKRIVRGRPPFLYI